MINDVLHFRKAFLSSPLFITSLVFFLSFRIQKQPQFHLCDLQIGAGEGISTFAENLIKPSNRTNQNARDTAFITQLITHEGLHTVQGPDMAATRGPGRIMTSQLPSITYITSLGILSKFHSLIVKGNRIGPILLLFHQAVISVCIHHTPLIARVNIQLCTRHTQEGVCCGIRILLEVRSLAAPINVQILHVAEDGGHLWSLFRCVTDATSQESVPAAQQSHYKSASR